MWFHSQLSRTDKGTQPSPQTTCILSDRKRRARENCLITRPALTRIDSFLLCPRNALECAAYCGQGTPLSSCRGSVQVLPCILATACPTRSSYLSVWGGRHLFTSICLFPHYHKNLDQKLIYSLPTSRALILLYYS